jgi:hypothetical protein
LAAGLLLLFVEEKPCVSLPAQRSAISSSLDTSSTRVEGALRWIRPGKANGSISAGGMLV